MWHKMLEQLPDHEYKINTDKNKMTPEEFAEEMRYLQQSLEAKTEFSDEESVHIQMDDLMCEVLSHLGYQEGVEIFYNTHKWYA